ncbi:MAG: hypothetical protein COY40_00665 [Alphaproteobacteria bacterium CG_4_10_14_0_8_um_filter_53_9]|nr:MAG: hypothetical protein COY40_00665 [Alphaproteobacteria bacterium CG_4_10_14_0_8_um_filter_53_9]
MVRPKAHWGYRPPSISEFQPKENELFLFKEKIESLSRISLSQETLIKISWLIIFYRSYLYGKHNNPSLSDSRKEIDDLLKLMDQVTMLDWPKKFSFHIALLLRDKPASDSLKKLIKSAEKFRKNIKELDDYLKKFSEHSWNLGKYREAILSEFLHLLAIHGYIATSTRNGNFEKCCELFLSFIKFTYQNETIYTPIPDDLHKTIVKLVKRGSRVEAFPSLHRGK